MEYLILMRKPGDFTWEEYPPIISSLEEGLELLGGV
jgi:hypothetical protein